MSVRAIDVVWRRYPVGGGELVVMLALADWANDVGTGIWPSVPALARKARLSDRQTQRLLRTIQRQGYIDAGGITEYGTRRYRLRLDLLGELPEITIASRGDVTPVDKMSPGNIAADNDTPNGADHDKRDAGSDVNVTQSVYPSNPVTPPRIAAVTDSNKRWPEILTIEQRQACEQVLRGCATSSHESLIAELAHRMARRDLPEIRMPHLWLRALIDAVHDGTFAPSTPVSTTRTDIESRYQRIRQIAESQMDERLGKLVAERAGGKS